MLRCWRSSVKKSDLKSWIWASRHPKKYSKKSRELHDSIEENQENLEIEIYRLKSLADIDKKTSSEEESVELESRSRLDRDRSLVRDNQGDLKFIIPQHWSYIETIATGLSGQKNPMKEMFESVKCQGPSWSSFCADKFEREENKKGSRPVPTNQRLGLFIL